MGKFEGPLCDAIGKMVLWAVGLLALFASYAAMAQEYRPATVQTLTYTSTSRIATTAFSTGVFAVRLFCTTDCWVTIGASSGGGTSISANGLVADKATGVRLNLEEREVFRVNPGEHVAVVQDATTGSINIVELTR